MSDQAESPANETPPTNSNPEPDSDSKNNGELKGKRTLLVLFRVVTRNHVALSAIADRKANFLLSLGAVLCSLTFTMLMRYVRQQPEFALPGLVLIVVCLVTILFAVLSTTPTVGKGSFTPDELKSKEVNLLFFGNFYRMKSEEYEAAVQTLLNDEEFLHKSVSNDIFHLGKTLARKFLYLRVSYIVFMVGIVLAILSGFLTFGFHLAWFTNLFR